MWIINFISPCSPAVCSRHALSPNSILKGGVLWRCYIFTVKNFTVRPFQLASCHRPIWRVIWLPQIWFSYGESGYCWLGTALPFEWQKVQTINSDPGPKAGHASRGSRELWSEKVCFRVSLRYKVQPPQKTLCRAKRQQSRWGCQVLE